MNKILELAEKYMDTASEHDYTELAIAIDNRQILEQTHITEDWLKEHGWEISHYDLPVKMEVFNYARKMFGKDMVYCNDKHQLTIFRDYDKENDIYADVLIDEVYTIGKLYAALDLCNIKID